MATGEEVAEYVLDVVQNDSFDEDSVLLLLNKCIKMISKKLVLPSLDTDGTVTATSTGSFVALPENFQRNLYHCSDGTPRNVIEVCSSSDQLSRYYDHLLSDTGTFVNGVAAVRPLLYYAPRPVEDTVLTLRYQCVPGTITALSEIDTILPDGFSDLFEFYALWRLYEKVEQGLEGQKVDTNHYRNLFLGMFDELALSLKEGVSLPPPPIARMEQW